MRESTLPDVPKSEYSYFRSQQIPTCIPKKDKQIIQMWIAESRAEIDAARLLVMDCAKQIDEIGSYGARKSVSVIKFYVAEVFRKVLDRAIQTHGALGITDDTPLAFWYRHERGSRIYDGPDEVHKKSSCKYGMQKIQPSMVEIHVRICIYKSTIKSELVSTGSIYIGTIFENSKIAYIISYKSIKFPKGVFLMFPSLIAILTLAACNKDPVIPTIQMIPKQKIEDNYDPDARLSQFQDCSEMRGYLAEVMTNVVLNNRYSYWYSFGGMEDSAESAPSEDGGGGSSEPTDYTTTNVQEEGVDELDISKTDGQYIYYIDGKRVHIVDSWPVEDTHKVAEIEIDGWGQNVFKG